LFTAGLQEADGVMFAPQMAWDRTIHE
jgi:hypothetical protein